MPPEPAWSSRPEQLARRALGQAGAAGRVVDLDRDAVVDRRAGGRRGRGGLARTRRGRTGLRLGGRRGGRRGGVALARVVRARVGRGAGGPAGAAEQAALDLEHHDDQGDDGDHDDDDRQHVLPERAARAGGLRSGGCARDRPAESARTAARRAGPGWTGRTRQEANRPGGNAEDHAGRAGRSRDGCRGDGPSGPAGGWPASGAAA